jgi:hypothetical protein
MANGKSDHDLLYFNGINGATGDYGLPPMAGDELSSFIQGEAAPENLNELRWRHQQKDQDHFGVKAGVDPKDLGQTGWGVIFAHDADAAVKEALGPLLELRQEQAGDYFRIYEGGDGYRPGESKSKFLARHGAGPGPADPEKVPYYLMIVGSPEAIPYLFQFQVDVQYAVGRIHFDRPEDYAAYASSVVAAETGGVKLPRQVGFFGVANSDDNATTVSADYLVEPLFDTLKSKKSDWQVDAYLREDATKAQLARLLGGDQTPAFLFTASHGMEYPLDDARQIPHQGALLCGDWPGPVEWRGQGPIPQDFYFAGDDLAGDASLLGLLTFHFACYGAGTPLNDDFSKQAFKERKAIAPHPFIAGLPTHLLSHPRGGALATVGHVERAWGYSFLWDGAGAQTTVFESTLENLLDGHPVGSAIEYFDERYAELASDLSVELEEIDYGKQFDPYELAGMWTANNDARSYVVIGDPAVRMNVVGPDETPSGRPAIEAKPQATTTPTAPQAEVKPEAATAPATQPPAPRARVQATASVDAEIEYGLRETGAEMARSLRDVSSKLADMLAAAVDDLTSLEVLTYTVDDISQVGYDPKTHRFGDQASLRAMTRIALDGDLLNVVPERASTTEAEGDAQVAVEIDEQLWAIHRDMVDVAQTHKVAFVTALAEVTGTIIRSLKV